jgi:glycosyltransferase involved in cell wall biosynthesis
VSDAGAVRGQAERPLVSVVIPSHQHAEFIEAAIGSVISQSYRPLELVVVDDGSTDDSLDRIERLRSRFASQTDVAPLVAFVVHSQPNQGADRALERAIGESRGQVVAILNSDDLFHPRRLELMVPALLASGGLAFSGVDFIDRRGAPLAEEHGWWRWYNDGAAMAEQLPTAAFGLLLRNFSVSSSNFLFSRPLYDRVGGFADYRFAHDWDFLLRAIYHREPVWVRAPLLSYRVHDGNTTDRVRDRLLDECTGAIRRYAALFAGAASPNPLAPWTENWPGYFPRFAAKHQPAWTERTLSEVLAAL